MWCSYASCEISCEIWLQDHQLFWKTHFRKIGREFPESEIMALFEQLHERGNTVIIVTHEADIAEHAKRVVRLHDGVVAEDTRSDRIDPVGISDS